MPKRYCPCGAVHNGKTQRCPSCQAQVDAKRGNTTTRGYGSAHQKLRSELLANWTPGDPCARCGQPMTDPARIDLGHAEGKNGYRGLEHDTCNRGNR